MKQSYFFSSLVLLSAVIACTLSFPGQTILSPVASSPSDTVIIASLTTTQVTSTEIPTVYATLISTPAINTPAPQLSPTVLLATATSSQVDQRIEFAPNSNSTLIQSEIAGGSQKEYYLFALQGQILNVDVQSPNFDVLLEIIGKVDGVSLISPEAGATNWSGILPSSQDYLIRVISVGGSTSFVMRIDLLTVPTPTSVAACLQTYIVKRGDYLVDIARRFGVDWRVVAVINHIEDPSRIYPGQVLCIPIGEISSPGVTPSVETARQRIQFAPGASSAVVEGNISPGEIKEYILRALQGQWMMVDLGLPNEDLRIAVYGLSDGNYLLSASEGLTGWQGLLPMTQDYVIQVISEGASSHYYLSVVIPERIQFPTGAYSKTIEGIVQGRNVNYYILRANAAQTMNVTIISPKSDVLLTIYGLEDGSPLVRYVSGATQWEGQLPATQDYIIEAVSVGETTTYTMHVTIR